jgi:hypothetical protein
LQRTVNISLVPMFLESLLQKLYGVFTSGRGEDSLPGYSFRHLRYRGSISRPGNSSLHAVPLKVMWIQLFRGQNKFTISLYGYFFASPTPFLALDQETDTRNHTHSESQEKCVRLYRHDIYEFENFLT